MGVTLRLRPRASSSTGIATWLLVMAGHPHGGGFMALCWVLGGFLLYGSLFPSVLANILVLFRQQFPLFSVFGVKLLLVGHWALCMDPNFWLFSFLDFFLLLSHLFFFFF